VFEDLITSEKEFLQDMDLFFRLYVGPIKAILPNDKPNGIFGNLENLVSANTKFLTELQMVQDGFMNIATVWDNFVVAINIYSVYCIFQQHSLGIVEQCRREHPNFDSHLRSVELTPESKNVNMFNFLVKPFARVVKYNSALKQLLQIVTTGEDHQSLVDVKKQFQDLHDTTNDTWKKLENSRKIAEIAGKLMGAEKAGLRKVGRVYIREGDFVINGKPMKLFLFSDIIMYAAPVKAILKKSGGKSHLFKGIIALNACSFQDLPDGKEGKNAMEITTASKSYKIQASSPSDKRLWVSDIKKCIAKLSGDPATTSNASPLGPRPMLDLGRRGPGSARQDSQTQMIEERRKTVKLAFGSAGLANDIDEEDKPTLIEETDEIQLEIKPGGGGQAEEDRRKTIKLEFGLPQRQLTIRDRSKTVELGFKSKETDESDGNTGETQDKQQIPYQQNLAFESPRFQYAEVEEQEAENDSVGDEVQVDVDGSEASQQEADTESKSDLEEASEDIHREASQEPNQDIVEEIEEQNKDILSSDIRGDNPGYFDSDAEYLDDLHKGDLRDAADGASDIIVGDSNAVTGDETNQVVGIAHQIEPSISQVSLTTQLDESNTPIDAQHLVDTITAPSPAEQHAPVQQVAEFPPDLYEAELAGDASRALGSDSVNGNADEHTEGLVQEDQAEIKVLDQAVQERHADHEQGHLDTQSQTQRDSAESGLQGEDHTEDHVQVGGEGHDQLHLQGQDSERLIVIAALQKEISTLKEGLLAANELATTTAQELEKEKEETKVWRARVERILAVLLDTMKQNTGGNGI
jgi:hypothetical protein